MVKIVNSSVGEEVDITEYEDGAFAKFINSESVRSLRRWSSRRRSRWYRIDSSRHRSEFSDLVPSKGDR